MSLSCARCDAAQACEDRGSFGSTLEVEVAMSFGDSAAVFKARAADIGLTDDEFRKLEGQGLTTMASFVLNL